MPSIHPSRVEDFHWDNPGSLPQAIDRAQSDYSLCADKTAQ